MAKAWSIIGIVGRFTTTFAPKLIISEYGQIIPETISRNDHCVYPCSTICLSRICGDIEIDDVSYCTKSAITQDVLDTFYAVKGLNGQPY